MTTQPAESEQEALFQIMWDSIYRFVNHDQMRADISQATDKIIAAGFHRSAPPARDEREEIAGLVRSILSLHLRDPSISTLQFADNIIERMQSMGFRRSAPEVVERGHCEKHGTSWSPKHIGCSICHNEGVVATIPPRTYAEVARADADLARIFLQFEMPLTIALTGEQITAAIPKLVGLMGRIRATASAQRVERIDLLERGIGELYQVIDCLADRAGVYDHPSVAKAMDWAANYEGECDLLPFPNEPFPTTPPRMYAESDGTLGDAIIKARPELNAPTAPRPYAEVAQEWCISRRMLMSDSGVESLAALLLSASAQRSVVTRNDIFTTITEWLADRAPRNVNSAMNPIAVHSLADAILALFAQGQP